MSDLLSVVQLVFLLPYILARAVYVIVSRLVIGKKINADEVGESKYSYILSGLVWLLLLAWSIYQSQFTYITYVYACPRNGGSKCYKVVADIVSEDCEDTEWDNRGAHGGRCTDAYVDKIYFDNGGYITFDSCDMKQKDIWHCYPETTDDGVWDIELSEVVKVRK